VIFSTTKSEYGHHIRPLVVSSFYKVAHRIDGKSAIRTSIKSCLVTGSNTMVRESKAFSPCNITGFFEIHRELTDPLQIGSTGVSIAIGHGVITQLTTRRARTPRFRATFNGRPLTKSSVSAFVAHKYAVLSGVNWDLRIAHHCQMPTGCGFGTSGAGALSLSFALNDALNLSLSKVEAAQIAHISEIVCGTGLGTVASVFLGGMTVRVRPGAPGEGRSRVIHTTPSTRVLTFSYGPLATQRVLRSKLLRQRVNKCGKGLTEEFDPRNPASSFMSLSKKFAECLGLASVRLSKTIKELDSNGLTSSMMMLGESLFSILPDAESLPSKEFLQRTIPSAMVSSITKSGACLI
ncbi:MAG TPA: hypothetical protein VFV92_07075, partial [Candidatus Bathyarchaeia archaeon]|nr:hypothetical protein [Candidatus Bathyarchaeia archaeon]